MTLLLLKNNKRHLILGRPFSQQLPVMLIVSMKSKKKKKKKNQNFKVVALCFLRYLKNAMGVEKNPPPLTGRIGLTVERAVSTHKVTGSILSLILAQCSQ